MAFGLEDDVGGSGGEFLDRINVDARTGFWTITRREQQNGEWVNIKSDPIMQASFLFDIGSLEVGWVKIASPPSFILAPFGSAQMPRKPEETTSFVDGKGQTKQKSAYSAGFRVKVLSKPTFGSDQPHYFSGNSKTLNGAVEELITMAMASPEAQAGKVPLVKAEKRRSIQVTTPQGTNTFYAPVFEIVSWHDRPDALGARIVPPPVASMTRAAPAQYAAQSAPAAPPANHVPPPAPVAAPAASAAPF